MICRDSCAQFPHFSTGSLDHNSIPANLISDWSESTANRKPWGISLQTTFCIDKKWAVTSRLFGQYGIHRRQTTFAAIRTSSARASIPSTSFPFVTIFAFPPYLSFGLRCNISWSQRAVLGRVPFLGKARIYHL